MLPADKRAGGCFLIAPILLGFAGGLALGNAMAGVWIGLGLGVMAAVAVWLLDRRND